MFFTLFIASTTSRYYVPVILSFFLISYGQRHNTLITLFEPTWVVRLARPSLYKINHLGSADDVHISEVVELKAS